MADVSDHTPLVTFMIITTLISIIVPLSVISLDRVVPEEELNVFAAALVDLIGEGLTGTLFRIALPNFFLDWVILYISAWGSLPSVVSAILLVPLLAGIVYTILKLVPSPSP